MRRMFIGWLCGLLTAAVINLVLFGLIWTNASNGTAFTVGLLIGTVCTAVGMYTGQD